jgi:rhamnose transport system ATP-binding protein
MDAEPSRTPATAQLDGISKRFGATQALDAVSLELRSAEIHALVGENGAGKSTLVKILAGVHRPDAGVIRLDGVTTHIQGPAHAHDLGIAVIHQEPRLFPDLSVAENVFIGRQPRTRLGGIDWSRMQRDAERLFAGLDVSIAPDSPVRGLSMADQQLVEIAKWLATRPRVLILDEPTRSSDLPEVLAMSDRVLVMHEGRLAAALSRAEATEERVMFAATGQPAASGAGHG